MIGVPLFTDECTSKKQRVTFARLLIEVDVTKELHKAISIEDINGSNIEQKVHFEWAPLIALNVMLLGTIVLRRYLKGEKSWNLSRNGFLRLLIRGIRQLT